MAGKHERGAVVVPGGGTNYYKNWGVGAEE